MKAIAIPDLYVTWVPGAVLKGKKLINEHNIDIVLTTIGPNSTALIGYFLRKLTSAKWVIDYRDPWCLNPFMQLGRLRYSLEKRLEDSMLARSDFNITTSELMTKNYRESYPNIADRFCTITNCYDQTLQFVTEHRQRESSHNYKFRVVHAGSFYPKRRPTSFLKALVALLNREPDIQSKIEVIFVGALSADYRDEIVTINRKYPVNCQLVGAVSYKESMNYICSADLLLAINGIEERDNVFIPGKIFDYIAANKPILLIGHSGPASEIVEDGNIGTVCAHEDIDGMSAEIFHSYRKWERSVPFEPDSHYIKRYHASNVTKQLAEILDSVADRRSDGK